MYIYFKKQYFSERGVAREGASFRGFSLFAVSLGTHSPQNIEVTLYSLSL
jgi:hypothetical protein